MTIAEIILPITSIRRVLGALSLIVLLAACAPAYWAKPGATRAEADAEEAACKAEAARSGLYEWNTSFVAEANFMSFVNNCMKARGYTGVYPWD
jgi:hypothetical protein